MAGRQQNAFRLAAAVVALLTKGGKGFFLLLGFSSLSRLLLVVSPLFVPMRLLV